MSAPSEVLLSRLEGVRARGPQQWAARCPTHDDGSPSLSVRELDDGVVLLHCFAGCDKGNILAAIGLEFSDLYPNSLPADSQRYGRQRARRPRLDGWAAVTARRHRLLVIALAAGDLAEGKELSIEDMKALADAAAEIHGLLEMAHGVR